MKRKSLLLAACLVAVVCAIGNAQPIPGGEVELSSINGQPSATVDSIFSGSAVSLEFTLRNTTSTNIVATTIGLEISTDTNEDYILLSIDSALWHNTMSPLYDGGTFISHHGGHGADTVGFGGFRITGPGFVPGSSVQSISMTVYIDAYLQWEGSGPSGLCIDSAFYPPGGEWLWSGEDGWGRLPSPVGFPRCIDIAIYGGWPPTINPDPPDNIDAPICETAEMTFTAEPNDCVPPPFEWTVISGIGSLGPDDGTGTATWSYTPSAADLGRSLNTIFKVCGESPSAGTLCALYQVYVNIVSGRPTFTSGCDELTEGVVGADIIGYVHAEDGPCAAVVNYSLSDVSPSPPAGYSFSITSGRIRLHTLPEDSGVVYNFTVRANDDEGDFIECTTSLVALHSPTCGDVNGDLATNISDMTYLVEFLFNDGPEPVATFAADFNCDGAVNITDMTYLVTYLFNDGPAPCAECP